MTLVLCPGDIYLRPKPSLDNGYISYSNDPDGARLSPPGIQLLATCQQAYDEGHNMYYSSNIFHLPPGPLDVTKALFDKFLPKHVALIRHISFRASSMDMTPAMLEQVDEMALHEHNYTYQPHSQRYGCKVLRDLDQEWVLKAIFMVTELPAVNSITFETAHKAATIDRNSSTWEIDSVELCRRLFSKIKKRIMCKILRDGWEIFRDSWCPEFVQETEDAMNHDHHCFTR